MARFGNLASYGALHLVQFISCAIFAGGIWDQGTYGPSKVCLLHINDYGQLDNQYVFQAVSSSCAASLGIGLLGVILSLVFAGIALYLTAKDIQPTRKYTLIAFVVSAIMSLILFIGAIVATDGVAKTCSQINTSGAACSFIFQQGFFEKDNRTLYSKNLTTIIAAVGAGWVAFLSWIAFAFVEFRAWRRSTSFKY
ncbi:hypothetical protein HK102_004802 [Quaeritorhiza haematococci]|nr:hypothetical protein HK102_004802 [Quaeritorhiza haematococci]